ncbi:MAG: uroporphyrinogen decarboxylase [Bacteroidales bacterium]|jgi:uroporphyrinogen decarboxylase|nr:uroporphyrinogen decarboxylase [Bacteroidales bacterium]
MNSIFTDTLQGKETSRPPVWFMRQAGRVLPSYLKLKENNSFWQLMKDPALAAEVTLLPIHDLGVDAAILFSDILVIPYAMGMGLDFTDNGPVFETPLKDVADPLSKLNPDPSKLQYIYDAIDKIIETRPENTPLIGFCGAPLTVLCFMLQGLGTRSNFSDAEKFFFTNKELTKKLAEAVTELSIVYALEQIKHGISAFQLFDTHAGLVPFEYYKEIFLPSVKKIADAVRKTGTPFIFFPKGIGTGISEIDYEICDYLSIDWQTPLHHARKMVDPKVGLQGNLDPRILFADKDTIRKELEKYIPFHAQEKNWIFNLGHGLMPGIPVENVQFVIDWIKETKW